MTASSQPLSDDRPVFGRDAGHIHDRHRLPHQRICLLVWEIECASQQRHQTGFAHLGHQSGSTEIAKLMSVVATFAVSRTRNSSISPPAASNDWPLSSRFGYTPAVPPASTADRSITRRWPDMTSSSIPAALALITNVTREG